MKESVQCEGARIKQQPLLSSPASCAFSPLSSPWLLSCFARPKQGSEILPLRLALCGDLPGHFKEQKI